MAKKKAAPKAAPTQEQPQASLSKMGAIKQLLAKGLSNPTEIATQAREQFGLDVKPIYVSNVKSQLKAKAKPGTKTARPDSLDAAVAFCEGVGGVDEAKTLLEKIDRIRNL